VRSDLRKQGIGTGLLLLALQAMREEGYAYAIIGGAGPTAFYERAVGAIIIPGSAGGIYEGKLPG
jgi:predicted N-acetyltransferase YhbS